MKTNFARLPALLIAAILFCASCKQAAVNPATTNTTDYKALSSQVGLSLYKSLTGTYGGTNINNGITPPANVSAATSRSFANAPANLLCGFSVTTGYNTKATAGDTAKTFFGNITFVYLCDNNVVDGYTVKDTVVNTEDNILQVPNTFIYNNYAVGQDYTVKALDQTYKLVSLNGTIAASITHTSHASLLTSPPVSEVITSTYVLTGLIISVNNNGVADITSGQATFLLRDATSAVNIAPGFAGFYSGIIQFLGNHTAKLTFFDSLSNKYTYSVNLLTGVATPI
jgi:hypothetical protein